MTNYYQILGLPLYAPLNIVQQKITELEHILNPELLAQIKLIFASLTSKEQYDQELMTYLNSRPSDGQDISYEHLDGDFFNHAANKKSVNEQAEELIAKEIITKSEYTGSTFFVLWLALSLIALFTAGVGTAFFLILAVVQIVFDSKLYDKLKLEINGLSYIWLFIFPPAYFYYRNKYLSLDNHYPCILCIPYFIFFAFLFFYAIFAFGLLILLAVSH